MLNQMGTENVQALIVTGDLNCRSSQWWPQDVEYAEGASLDKLIESNNLFQLIDEPTNTQWAEGQKYQEIKVIIYIIIIIKNEKI